MTIASRFFAGFAAFALALAGIAAIAPSSARAQVAGVPGALVAGTIITATVLTAVVLLDKGGSDDDEQPQSP